MTSDRPPRREVEIEVGALARARRVRFKGEPETRVEFSGEPEVVSETLSARENLPEEVEPGEVYRDVRVGWVARVQIAEEAVEALEERIEERSRRGDSPPS